MTHRSTPLANVRHERFAEQVAQGKTHREAFIGAGFVSRSRRGRDVAAWRLCKNDAVRRRIDELRHQTLERAALTTDGLIAECTAIQARAFAERDFHAALGALIAKARLAGLWRERREQVNVNYQFNDLLPSETEWQRERCADEAPATTGFGD
jgi:hypothetical protein